MIHMLSAFDMRPGEDQTTFLEAYASFVADLQAEGLIVSAGPVGTRVADTPMDTDEVRTHQYFSLLAFHDRAQLDNAYRYLATRRGQSTGSHNDMYARITNSVFLCWQDTPPPSEKET